MMPVVAQVRELLGDNAKIYQLDIDRDTEAADKASKWRTHLHHIPRRKPRVAVQR